MAALMEPPAICGEAFLSKSITRSRLFFLVRISEKHQFEESYQADHKGLHTTSSAHETCGSVSFNFPLQAEREEGLVVVIEAQFL